ncbi:alpha/beta hydrolase [Streptomyces sp. YIM 130001]|uniref:alpha/beta fold hydrolase n=1 Tax=Streptomyces sp. YIM 130001 TaxID=2259644 RepID=UPI001F09087A|nr:alpha/beta hydrolase [Streptomyces sp. YIM 130001]
MNLDDVFRLDTGPAADSAQAAGPPLVLLHGGFLDHGMWFRQIPVLAERHRVIAPDARGHGRSAGATEPFRPVDDVAALLRESDTGPAVVIGVSMGAATAVDLALEYPDLVRGLVVSGAGTSEPYFTDPWTTATAAGWQRAMAAGDLDASVEAFTLFAAGPRRSLDEVDPDVVDRLRRMARATMSQHTADEPDFLLPVHRTWERAADIGVPVLAVNGAVDSPDHIGMAERLVRTVPDGRAICVDGAAHYPNMERPDVFDRAVGEFLRGL